MHFQLPKKPLLFVVTVLIIFATVLSACAPAQPAAVEENPTEVPVSEEPEAEKVVLRVGTAWGDADTKGPILKSIVDDFMAANPDIEIKLEVYTTADMKTQIEVDYVGKKEPEIIFYGAVGAKEWLETGLIVPIDEYYEAWGFEDTFYSSALKEYTFDGQLTGFPLEGFTWPIWYNTNILTECGVDAIPTTTDELIAAAEKIRANGYQPFVVGGGEWPGARFFQLLLQSYIGDEEARTLFANGGFADSPQAVAAVEEFVRLRNAGVFNDNVEGTNAATMNEMFYAEQAAIMMAGSWAYAEPPAEMMDHIQIGGLPIAASSPYDKPTWWSAYLAVAALISRNGANSGHMAEIEQFIKFVFQEEMVARFVEQTGMTPPMDLEVDEAKLNPLFAQALKLDPTTTRLQQTDAYWPTDKFASIDKVCSSVFIPGTTAEEILEQLDAVYAE